MSLDKIEKDRLMKIEDEKNAAAEKEKLRIINENEKKAKLANEKLENE